MPKHWTLVTPVPQWTVPEKWPGCDLKPGFRVAPMLPEMRRVLLNAAKEKESNDHVLSVLVRADTVAMSAVPASPANLKNEFITAAFHQMVADGLLRRIFECVRLFANPGEDVPEGFWHSCWFLLEGKPESVCLERAKCMHSEWNPDVYPPWDMFDPVDVAEALDKVQKEWSRLSKLCRVEVFFDLDADPKSWRGYTRAANANVERKTEELEKVRLAESQQEAGSGVIIDKRQIATWLIEGVRDAMRHAVDKLEARDYGRGARLTRAFQFFQDAFRLEMPHRYVSLAISLESLLSLGNEGVTSQLASRIAWLLYPNDAGERMSHFGLVKIVYDIRSRIVHGGACKTDEVETWYMLLLYITRRVLIKVISEERLFRTFFNRDPKDGDALLKRLSLGCEL